MGKKIGERVGACGVFEGRNVWVFNLFFGFVLGEGFLFLWLKKIKEK